MRRMTRQTLGPVLGTMVAVVGLIAGATAPATAQQPQPDARPGPVLTVRGEGKHSQAPEIATFHAVVSTQGTSLEEATKSHAPRATEAAALLDTLKTDGLAVEKSEFRLVQDRPFPTRVLHQQVIQNGRAGPPSKPPEPRFTANTTFSLKSSRVADLNAIVTRLAASGLFEIRQLQFAVVQQRAGLNQARRAAMTDAQEQAQAYAEAGNFELVEIMEVTDGEASPYEGGAADLPVPRFVQIIPPATVSFQATVKVTWRIRRR